MIFKIGAEGTEKFCVAGFFFHGVDKFPFQFFVAQLSFFSHGFGQAVFGAGGRAVFSRKSGSVKVIFGIVINIGLAEFTAGLRWDAGRYSVFTETGYVFDRQAKFAGSTPPFSVAPTAIFSVGLRY